MDENLVIPEGDGQVDFTGLPASMPVAAEAEGPVFTSIFTTNNTIADWAPAENPGSSTFDGPEINIPNPFAVSEEMKKVLVVVAIGLAALLLLKLVSK